MTFNPTLDDAMRKADEISWEDFEAIGGPSAATEKARLAAKAKRAELAGCAARIAMSPDGAKLFKMLVDVTLFRPQFCTRMGLDMAESYGEQAFRDGQNALVSQLLKLAAEGGARDAAEPAPETVKPPKRKGKR